MKDEPNRKSKQTNNASLPSYGDERLALGKLPGIGRLDTVTELAALSSFIARTARLLPVGTAPSV
jgi:hypothetical protein